jgi:signal transduction histidine kinase
VLAALGGVVGPERSGDAYFDEDVALLGTLVAEAAVALANARLHRDVMRAREQIEAILQTMPSAVVADGARPVVCLEIADTGPGISDAVRETVFEPFVTTKRHGTGLGLALCRAIVDVHRGTIRAENRDPGPGARFSVEFPADAATSG